MATANPKPIKKRYLSGDQCKAAAAQISAQMRTYPEDMDQWNRHGTAPVVPLWGPDFDAVTAKIEHLYHQDEAALIIEALTP